MGDHLIIERYLWFDGQVRDGKFPNAASLARQYATTRKTGQRNIDRMRVIFDAPLAYDNKRKGYYYTDEGFSLLHHQVNQEEARRQLKEPAPEVLRDYLAWLG